MVDFLNAFRYTSLLVLLCFPAPVSGAWQEPTVRTAFLHLNVVDVVNGKVLEDQTVVIQGAKIVSVSPSDTTILETDVRPIDMTGKFMIPGLWDMHIHWYHASSMALFPLNGVTGVRVMWGMHFHRTWQNQFLNGDALGPDMSIGSPIVDGPEPIWAPSLVANDAASAVDAVQKAVDMKSDFVKVYSLLSREAYFEIAREAKRQSLPFAGHVPYTISIAEASDAGQRSMEHLYEFFIATSSQEEELRKLRTEVIQETGISRTLYDDKALMGLVNQRALASYDPAKAQQLFEKLARNETWQCPTLTVLRNLAYLETETVQNNPNLKYIPAIFRQSIAPEKDPRGRNAEQFETSQKTFKRNLELLLDMHRAGVPILAGTDCLNPFCLPGFSLHTELELMVQAGLTPLEAIKTATINPAKFLNREHELGSIDPGKIADLVILAADPTQDITNTQRIETVIIRGQILDADSIRMKLEEMDQSKR